MKRLLLSLLAWLPLAAAAGPAPLVFRCAPDNDLYRVLSASGARYARYATTAEAVAKAPRGAGVLILADGYPDRTTPLDQAVLDRAAAKRLRLYVEYPGWLPAMQTGAPRRTKWERTVVASDAFGAALPKLRILAIHDCHFVPLPAQTAELVTARVAGFDTAVYGLPEKDVYPILFRHPAGNLLVATTKLSQFVTARYAPSDAWKPIWQHVLAWLLPGQPLPALEWTPEVRPSYTREARLPAGFEREAFRRGVEWFERARMLVHPSWNQALLDAAKFQDQVGPMPDLRWPAGDGSLGLLEGFNASIRWDGTQPVRWWLRNDCMGEAAMAFAFSGTLDNQAQRRRVAANLNDFIAFRSPLTSGSRGDPKSASFGLAGWNTTPKYYKDLDGFGVYYGDDNARSMLGTMATAALLGSDRWDEYLLRCLLGNLRTTGKLGFRDSRLDEKPLQEKGWRYYWNSEKTNYAPHYEAYLWATFLWAYDRTGYRPFLERTKTAIRMTMAAYPDQWHWTNGIQQERARMLLPLAWLVRLEDTPEHRAWLHRVAEDLLALQDGSGAIREEIGSAGKGDYGPPKSNAAYGTSEATLIQQNGDSLADLLYTTNFAFLGLHEAAAATGERPYRDAEDRLAAFLARIQVRSERHPELDGAWFRAFEYRRWEYWASNADAGWGAWSIETGWTQAWITSVFAMRHQQSNFWDITKGSGLRRHLDQYVRLMFGEGGSRQ